MFTQNPPVCIMSSTLHSQVSPQPGLPCVCICFEGLSAKLQRDGPIWQCVPCASSRGGGYETCHPVHPVEPLSVLENQRASAAMKDKCSPGEFPIRVFLKTSLAWTDTRGASPATPEACAGVPEENITRLAFLLHFSQPPQGKFWPEIKLVPGNVLLKRPIHLSRKKQLGGESLRHPASGF